MNRRFASLAHILFLATMMAASASFQCAPSFHHITGFQSGFLKPTGTTLFAASDVGLLEQIRSMRVKEIKAELSALQISSAHAFEKEELVKRLFKAKMDGPQTPSSTSKINAPSDVVRSTLYFTSMDSNRRISAENDAELSILPSDDRFTFGDKTYCPLPAAVQDIGALPSTLDGIIGLSFVNQFACVEMDFKGGFVTLYTKERVSFCWPSRAIAMQLSVVLLAKSTLMIISWFLVSCFSIHRWVAYVWQSVYKHLQMFN